MSLEKYIQLERDPVKFKDKLNKSLNWTASFKILSDMTNQKSNNWKGLGYMNMIDPPV